MRAATATIRELNDAFRTSMTGGRVVMTAGVNALASDVKVKAMVIRTVSTFADFTPDNDPHGEHDLGSFELAGQKFFWKIELLRRRHAVRLGGSGRPCQDHPRADHPARERVLAVSAAWNPADPFETWLALGRENRWIRRACDPPFTRASFTRCTDTAELKAYLEHGNWCLGSAFHLGDLCFIEQVAGAGEWLVIKQNVAFESASCGDMMT